MPANAAVTFALLAFFRAFAEIVSLPVYSQAPSTSFSVAVLLASVRLPAVAVSVTDPVQAGPVATPLRTSRPLAVKTCGAGPEAP